MIVREGNRLIIDFEKVACCIGQETGLHPQVKDRIPLEIESGEYQQTLGSNGCQS